MKRPKLRTANQLAAFDIEAVATYISSMERYADHLEAEKKSLREDAERMTEGMASVSQARLDEMLRLEEENTALRERLAQSPMQEGDLAQAQADRRRIDALDRAIQGLTGIRFGQGRDGTVNLTRFHQASRVIVFEQDLPNLRAALDRLTEDDEVR